MLYGIIGEGKANEAAITAALNDLNAEESLFVVPNRRSDPMEPVWDWLIDQDALFDIVGEPGKSLRKYANKVILDMPVEDPDFAVLQYLTNHPEEHAPTILVLWDDSENCAKNVLFAASKNWKILELTNGLAPITVDEEEAPVEQEEQFNAEELESMPIAAVKRLAVNAGIDVKGKTREEIVASLLPQKRDENPLQAHDTANEQVRSAAMTTGSAADDIVQAATILTNVIMNTLSDSRERQQAIINLEQAIMWATRSL